MNERMNLEGRKEVRKEGRKKRMSEEVKWVDLKLINIFATP